MPLTNEIDPMAIRDQLDRWEIDINRELDDPPTDLFQLEMRRRHGSQIELWIRNLENIRNQLQPEHGHCATGQRDPQDLTPPGVVDPAEAGTVAEIYSLIGYLRSEIGRN